MKTTSPYEEPKVLPKRLKLYSRKSGKVSDIDTNEGINKSRSRSRNRKVHYMPWRANSVSNISHQNRRISLGNYGLKKGQVPEEQLDTNVIRRYPNHHLLAKVGGPVHIWIFGNTHIINQWYSNLEDNVRKRLKGTVFQKFINRLHATSPNKILLQALAEKSWDTTHTFHFDCMGEMTVTPTDFNFITGFPMTGKPIKFDNTIDTRKEILFKYLGSPTRNISEPTIDLCWLFANYGQQSYETKMDEDIMIRGFILGLLSATLFATSDNRVHLGYLPSLYNLDDINKYDWGSAGIAFLYHQMDDVCQNNTTCLGGYWTTWQEWVQAYLPKINYPTPTMKALHVSEGSSSPKTLHAEEMMLNQYRLKLTKLMIHQVNWRPWCAYDNDLLAHARSSSTSTRKRKLLSGPHGGAWYLGERVSVQSLQSPCFLVPKRPPKSMLFKDIGYPVTHAWAFKGRSAYQFVKPSTEMEYETYRKRFLTTYDEVMNECHETSVTKQNTLGSVDEDFIPRPPWTVLVPSPVGRAKLICIPTDIEIENFHIPPDVQHVSIVTARKLLQMVAGMQHVLVENLTNARQTLNEYATVIQKLRYKLDTRLDPFEWQSVPVQMGVHALQDSDDNISDANNALG